jgi:DNA-binding beta-propeller fold protein YncE
MKLFLIGFLGAGLGLVAQAPQAALKIDGRSTASHGAQPRNAVGTAVLGFLEGPGPSELSAILGIFGAARIGPPVAVPETVTQLYLSARQRYALVEQKSGGPIAIWGLDETVLTGDAASNGGLVAIAGALPRPDMVTFSPTGESVVLYSRASGQLQVISGMPEKPVIHKTPPLDSPGTIAMIAVSDDASVLVTKDAAGDVRISTGGTTWQPFYGAYSPLAWAFIPKTNDLIISDSQEHAVFLIERAGSTNARLVLAENCSLDRLAVTGDGQTLVALDSTRSILSAIDLKSRISNLITPAQNPNSLAILRNGNTFVASSRDANPTLLKVSAGSGVQTAAIHAATAPGGR